MGITLYQPWESHLYGVRLVQTAVDAASPEQTRLLWTNCFLSSISGISNGAAISLSAQILSSALPYLMCSGGEVILREAFDLGKLYKLTGALFITILSTHYNNIVTKRTAALFEQDFLAHLIGLDQRNNAVSIYNHRCPAKPLDLNSMAESYAKILTFWLNKIPGLVLNMSSYLCVSYLSTNLASKNLPSFLIIRILPLGITIINGFLNYLSTATKLSECDQANANLHSFISNFQKGNYSQTIHSLTSPLFKKLGDLKLAGYSLLSPSPKILLDVVPLFAKKIIGQFKLLVSIYFGIDTFAYQLSSYIVSPFDLRDCKFNADEVLLHAISIKDSLECLDTLSPKWIDAELAEDIALVLPKGFTIQLPDGTKQASVQAPIQIKYGRITEIRGEKGSGKSTFASIMAGHADLLGEGSFYYKDQNLTSKSIFVIPADKNMAIPETTWLEFIAEELGVKTDTFDRIGEIRSILKSLKLDKFLAEPGTPKLDETINSASRGEWGILLLAKAIYRKAKLIVLDETFATVPTSDRPQLMKFVKQYATTNNAAIVSITHEPYVNLTLLRSSKQAQYADSIISFKQNGQVTDLSNDSAFIITQREITHEPCPNR